MERLVGARIAGRKHRLTTGRKAFLEVREWAVQGGRGVLSPHTDAEAWVGLEFCGLIS